MPQPQSRQQSRLNDIQMLQRQIMLKQLQELQRQQQFQELGGDTRQQNYLNQQSSRFNKQASVSQYPPFINGTPIHDPAQMFMVNNLNLMQLNSTPAVQGFPNAFTFPQAQTQQPEISLYGTPLYGDVHDPGRMFTENEPEKPIVEERDLFGLVPSQDLKSEVSKQEQGGWPGNFPVKTTTISSSQNVASLDPLEQKILFSLDDNSWDSSFGMRGNIEAGGFGNINSDNLNSFPLVQSGSWSALMQSAVGEASSSDTGVQEDWSGLSFQNQEISTNNQPSTYMATGKQQSQWVDSKPEVMFNNSNTSFPGFQQPGIEFSVKHNDTSHESAQHSPKHAFNWLEGQRQSPSQSSWPDQNFLQSENSSRLHNVAGDSKYSFQRENSMDSYHSNASQKSAGQSDQDQGYVGQFKNSSISYSSMESDKGRVPNVARNSKESDNFPSRSNAESSTPSFFERPSTSQRTNVNAQTSQNMLELFNKVDKSTTEHGMHFGARKSTSSEVPQTESYAKSSASECFNLNLAPPSQQTTSPNCFGSPQSSPQMVNHGLTFSSGPFITNLVHNQHLSSAPPVSHRSEEDTPGSGSTFPGFSPVASQETNDHRQFPFSLTQPNVWRNISTQQNFSGIESQRIPLDTRSSPDSPNSSQVNARGNLFRGKESVVASGSFLSSSQVPEISARDLEVFGRSLRHSHTLPQNYSLMHQVQTMKNVPEKYDDGDSNTNVQQVNYSNLASSKSEQSKNNAQMASSWYNHFGTLRNSQTLLMNDARAATFTSATQQLSAEKSHENMAQLNEVGSSQAIWPTTVIPSSAVTNQNVSDQKLEIVKSKKRKYVPVKLLPWHREVTEGCQRLQDIRYVCSMTDEEWARAANRQVEKVDNNAEMIEDALLIPRPKKRLVRTTMLMQQLFRPAPQIILSENAALSFDTMAYFSARLVLGDACSMTNPTSDRSIEEPNPPPDEIIDEHKFPEIIEEFMNRIKKLEDEFLRLGNSASILDIRVEHQEMERFSIINRFAKFHIRGQVAAAETSTSTSIIPAASKSFPQRYVTAVPMLSIVPEQGQCISL